MALLEHERSDAVRGADGQQVRELGKAAWWLPAWLDRVLPRISVEGGDYFARRPAPSGGTAATGAVGGPTGKG